jgi:hypothetical protein
VSGKWRGFKLMKRKLVVILCIFVGLIILSHIIGKGWIIYREGAFKGKVIDAETKEPIEGAIVVATYYVEQYGFVESNTMAIDAKEVLTNRNGEFYIPPHLFVRLYLVATKDTTQFIIFKPGYACAEGPEYVQLPSGFIQRPSYPMIAEAFRKGATVELVKVMTKEERLRNIPDSPTGMRSRKLPLLFKAINEEHRRFGLAEVR